MSDTPPAHGWVGWLKLPGRRWSAGPGAATWSEAWDQLRELLATLEPAHAEAVVLPAGRHPEQPREPQPPRTTP